MLGTTGLFARQLPLRLFRDPDGLPYYFTNFSKVHRLQLPASSAHTSVIAFDTQQELLWTGDETVGISLYSLVTTKVERLGRLLMRMLRVESPLTMGLTYESILRSVRILLKKAQSPSFCSIKPALSLWHREVYIISPEEA